MFGNITFGLTALTYIALVIFNFQTVNVTGERLVGWGIIAFALLAAYVVCSLILTISIVANGGFNWLSNTEFWRVVGVGILWLGMVADVVFCTMIRTEFHADRSTGFMRLLTSLIYFGATWLPLLMLLPYAILLNPGWRDALSPNFYKAPLLFAGAIGFIINISPKIATSMVALRAAKVTDESQLAFNNSMRIINNEQSIQGLFYFAYRAEDERLRNAALNTIIWKMN